MQSSKLVEQFLESLQESAAAHGIAIDTRKQAKPDSPFEDRLGTEFVTNLRNLGEELDDAFYGLADGRCPADAPAFGMELMLLSVSLGEALDRYLRFYAIATSGLSMSLSHEGPVAIITLEHTNPGKDPRNFLIEWYAARLTSMSQWLTAHELPEMEVEFAHSRTLPPESYTAAYGENLSFDRPANRIILPKRYLGMRVVRTIEDSSSLSKEVYDPEHRTIGRRRWSSLMRTAIRDCLLQQEPLPTMDKLARDYGVSSQTLRRHLKAEGKPYREIKAEARRDVVLSSLADPSLSIGEISQIAGFSDPNGLLRAMKAWTGMSVTAYRQSLLKGEL